MGYDIIEEAENYAWWASLDRDIFASLIMERVFTTEIDSKEFKVADFLNTEQVKEIWDESHDQVEQWARDKYSKASQNGYILWMAVGIIIGYIRGKGD